MNKDTLRQYVDICHEIEDTRRRIRDIECRIDNCDTITETVKGGSGGDKRIRIDGKPHAKEDKTRLYARRLRLKTLEARLIDIKDDIEAYVCSISDSHIRRIITYRYIDDMTWEDVARNMGEGYTADSIRIEHQRFLRKKD